MSELVALLEGRIMGVVRRERGRLSFVYDDAWRRAPGAFPVSLSMPLTAAEHGQRPVEAFLWGLLPDNALILERWAKRFQVSARNPFALVGEVGEDCAGAVQFVKPARLEQLETGKADNVDWLSEADVAERLRALRADQAAWRAPRDTGQFSLAGAQPKTAFLFEDGRWGVPSGRLATTHILKPPTGEFDGHAENEHFCLTLAQRLGLPTAASRVAWFEDQPAIVVERYDRAQFGGRTLRIHQEDLCQALAHPPSAKYENEGGPGVRDCARLVADHSSSPAADLDVFLDAILLNWIICGTDAHAKNYSVLIAGRGQVRLAPLYDVASALAYPDLDFQKLKLAMRMGDEYRIRDIAPRHLERMAVAAGREPRSVIRRAGELAQAIAELAPKARDILLAEGLQHPIIPRMAEALADRANGLAVMILA